MSVFHQELTPVHFLERAGTVYRDQIAVIDGENQWTWNLFRARARRFAWSLHEEGIQNGDCIAFLCLNSEPILLAHFAVPMAGAVLVAINTRLTADDIQFILNKSKAKMVFVSPELSPLLDGVSEGIRVITTDSQFESFLQNRNSNKLPNLIQNESDLISINFTSGTTGMPKGVMNHHRGAYVNSLAMAIDHRLTSESTYLWTLPMFHCNGWMFPWSLAAVGAKSVCIPKIDPPRIWRLFQEGITHFCAAPTVLTMILNDPAVRRLDQPIRVFTAGAPPSPTLVERMMNLNFQLEHVYGLTETYGPFTINVAPESQKNAAYKVRQGFANVCAGEVRVVDDFMHDVPKDGKTMGEVVMRGNVVMKGYFDDESATSEAFSGGWFHSGDLGVMHEDGSIELRDRKKDIIISGGENISTIEIEQIIVSHNSVLECAVVAIPDEKWGEVPKAFVTLKENVQVAEQEIIDYCREKIAHFKAPKAVEFGPLPKTSTGKIQKFVLKEREWKGRNQRIN